MMDGIGTPQDSIAGLIASRVSEVTQRLELDPEKALGKDDAQAAKAFESYFNTILVKELRRGLPTGMFEGTGADVYTAWFDEHVGNTLASRDALGIGAMIRSSLARAATVIPAAELGELDQEEAR